MTKETFVTALAMLSGALNRQLSAEATEGYWAGLQGLSDDEMKAATRRALVECKFMPSPSELLAFVGKGPRDFAFETAQAWEAVRRAMDRYDYTDSVDFGPLVNAVIRNLGGWVYLCGVRSLSDLDTWKRKEFERLYESFAHKPIEQLNGGFLVGEHRTEVRQIAIGGVTPPKQLPAAKDDRGREMRGFVARLANGKTL